MLYVAARAPRPGFAKSRLGRTIGHERASALYSAFVQDLAERLEASPFPVGWYVTPDDAWIDLAPLIPSGRTVRGEHHRIIVQPPGDWTERQRVLFASAQERLEQRTVLIASDSPQLDVDLIGEAFEQLQRDDLVLGPTQDGGYYLIGMRTPCHPTAARPWDALSGVRMSTGTVLDEILMRAAGLGLRTSLLSPTFDIDEEDDLDRLIPLALVRDDLAATRAALERLGLIRFSTGTVEQSSRVAMALCGVR
jgi:uncharacterized protein